MEEKSLYITASVQKFLWQNYNPKDKESREGILLAGLGDDGFWYANTASFGEQSFDFVSGKGIYGVMAQDYLQKNKETKKIIPWKQYLKKDYDSDLGDFINEFIVTPFDSLIVLKPTAEKGKKHFVLDYLLSGDHFEQASLEVINSNKINLMAEKNISQLMENLIQVKQKIDQSLTLRN